MRSVVGIRRGNGPLRAVVTGALVTVLSLAGVGPASASLSANPDASWGVNGTVFSVAHLGNTVYVGGHFSSIVSNDADPVSLPAENLAAFNASTGQPLAWRPRTSGGGAAGAVYGVTPSPTGDRVYVEGSFTAVNGFKRNFVAAVNPVSGAVFSDFAPRFSYRVYTVLARGNRLYVGGNFLWVNGVRREHLVALDTNGNVVLGWWANTLGTYLGSPTKNTNWRGRVVSIAASAGGRRLFVAGDFTAVNGVTRRSLAAVNIGDGSTDTTFKPDKISLTQAHRGQQIFDLEVLPDRVYVAMGGRANYLAAYDTTDGHRVRFMNADGDLQSLTRIDSILYISGHFDQFALRTRHRLAAVNMATGKVDPWAPTTDSYYGVWSIDASVDRLFAGGAFTLVNGNVRRAHFAQFSSG